MSATVPEIWSAFADVLSVLEVQVYQFVPDSIIPPCLVVYPERWTLDTNEDMTFIVWCIAGTGEIKGEQGRLMSWLSDEGPDSVIAAIDADSRLGGIISSVIPFEVRNWGIITNSAGSVSSGTRLLQAELVCNLIR